MAILWQPTTGDTTQEDQRKLKHRLFAGRHGCREGELKTPVTGRGIWRRLVEAVNVRPQWPT